MDCIVHGVAKSRTQLNDFHFHFPLGGHRDVFGKALAQMVQKRVPEYQLYVVLSIGLCCAELLSPALSELPKLLCPWKILQTRKSR